MWPFHNFGLDGFEQHNRNISGWMNTPITEQATGQTFRPLEYDCSALGAAGVTGDAAVGDYLAEKFLA